jgi:hypothetical protein
MTPDPSITAYRDHLLRTLSSQLHCRHRIDAGRIDLFVNLERVGTLDCARSDPSLTYTCRGRVVHHVEVRGEDGALVGGLNASERDVRVLRITLFKGTLDLVVSDRMDEGSVHLAIRSTPTLLNRIQLVGTRVLAGFRREPGDNPDWRWAPAAVQVALVLAVLALGTDRFLDSIRKAAAPRDSGMEVTAIGAQLERLTQSGEASRQLIQAQRDEMTQLRNTLAAVTTAQQRMASDVKSVSRAADERGNIGEREIEHMSRVLMSKLDAERGQFRKELHGLVLANEALAKQVTALENSNVELKNRLKSAGVDISKALSIADMEGAEKSKDGSSTQVAEGRAGTSIQPFTFWVSFQDGTSDENIEHMIQEVHGRKGKADEGWYPVELPAPPPAPLEGFLENVRHAKFVKAVSMTHLSPPGPNR